MLSKLSSLLLSSLLLAGAAACATDEGFDPNGENSDEVADVNEGIGSLITTLRLSSEDIATLGTLHTTGAFANLTNLKYHASGIDSEFLSSNLLIFRDSKNHFEVGVDYDDSEIYAYAKEVTSKAEFEIILDIDVTDERKVAFWSNGTKFFAEMKDPETHAFRGNNVSLNLYEATATPGVAVDAFMSEGDRIDFQVGDNKWYSFTLYDTDVAGFDVAHFLIETPTRDCYDLLDNCENLLVVDVNEGVNSPTFSIDDVELRVDVLSEITNSGGIRVQLAKADSSTPTAPKPTTPEKDPKPVDPEPEVPGVGELGGACESHASFPGTGTCQFSSSACTNGTYVGGLCNAASVSCCYDNL